jgi:hypothetical protein
MILHRESNIFENHNATGDYLYGTYIFCITGQRGGNEGGNPLAHNHAEESAKGKFQAILQDEVPKGREGKHKRIVSELLSELERLAPGTALKVPMSALPDSKENIRAALNRATRQRGMQVATSSDAGHLYIWNNTGKS